MFVDSELKDKVAIVTGGSRGIGREIVGLLAKEGVKVSFFYKNSQAEAKALESTLRTQGHSVQALQVDVADPSQSKKAVDTVFEQFSHIDILVNNSGIVRDNLLVGLAPEQFDEVIKTNLYGAFHVLQAVVPIMMAQRGGKIINMSSVAAEKAGRGHSNYAASKGGINALTKALAVELAPRNIKVNAVAPGIVDTQMSQAVRERGGDQILDKILLKRYAKPEEVAYTVGFLASRYSDYLTGVVLPVDGGFKMG